MLFGDTLYRLRGILLQVSNLMEVFKCEGKAFMDYDLIIQRCLSRIRNQCRSHDVTNFDIQSRYVRCQYSFLTIEFLHVSFI